MTKQTTSWFLAVGALLLCAVCSAQSPMFTVKVLGNIAGGTRAYVEGINDAGVSAGSVTGTSVCPKECAVTWSDGVPTVLGAMEGAIGSEATSINTSGQVAGFVIMPNSNNDVGLYQAALWTDGTPTLLSSPKPQYIQTYAASLNDAGQVAGSAFEVGDGAQGTIPVMWNGLTPTVLNSVSGFTGGALASGINSSGVAVGTDYHNQERGAEAVVWHGAMVSLLPALKDSQGTPASKALAINNSGLIVGLAATSDGTLAAAWDNGVVTSLGVLGTGQVSSATAVNNLGIIVGQSDTVGTDLNHATLWGSSSASPQDLNSLISSAAAARYALTSATGINDSCAIVANGYDRKTGAEEAFLLTPIEASNCVNGM